jgi:hypothetical protein
MVTKQKRGPKPKPENEKKVPVKIWVKKKYFTKAQQEANAIERKYNTNES